jgi:O-antigen ligase
LLLPLFVSFTARGRKARIASALLVLAMLLSVSLTGMFSALIGLILAMMFLNPLRRKNVKVLLGVFSVLGLLIIGAQYVQIGALGAEVTIFSMVEARIEQMFEGGVGATNRAGVFQFVVENPPPWYGFGMGNGNIYPARVQNSDVMMSYLSAYIAIWYSAGVAGLTLLLLFMVRPLARIMAGRGRGMEWMPLALAAYIAYLVSFTVLTEELSIHFGVAAALVFYGTMAVTRRHAVPLLSEIPVTASTS